MNILKEKKFYLLLLTGVLLFSCKVDKSIDDFKNVKNPNSTNGIPNTKESTTGINTPKNITPSHIKGTSNDEITKLETEISSLEKKISAEEGEIMKEKNLNELQISNLRKEISNLREKISKKEIEIQTARTEIEKIKNEIKDVDSKIDSLNLQKKNQSEKDDTTIKELEEKIKKENEEFEEKKANLDAELNSLTQEKANVNAETKKLEEEIAKLGNVNKLTEEVKLLEAEILSNKIAPGSRSFIDNQNRTNLIEAINTELKSTGKGEVSSLTSLFEVYNETYSKIEKIKPFQSFLEKEENVLLVLGLKEPECCISIFWDMPITEIQNFHSKDTSEENFKTPIILINVYPGRKKNEPTHNKYNYILDNECKDFTNDKRKIQLLRFSEDKMIFGNNEIEIKFITLNFFSRLTSVFGDKVFQGKIYNYPLRTILSIENTENLSFNTLEVYTVNFEKKEK